MTSNTVYYVAAIAINSSANVTINTNVGAVVNMSAVARDGLGLGVGQTGPCSIRRDTEKRLIMTSSYALQIKCH